MSHSVVVLNPFVCILERLYNSNRTSSSVVAFFMYAAFWVCSLSGEERKKDISETDERNFDYSVRGTYGTAGYMKPEEQKEIFKTQTRTYKTFWGLFLERI